jgi:lipoate-protein ligase A
MKKVRVLLSETYDPWFNLATEDWIFREMDPKSDTLFLWRNDNTVVIGRYQNPWEECNLKAMERDNVKLARRQSGGGAVYHDLGNTNFTFLSGRKDYDKEANSKIIINALRRFGIHAETSGRNDILVEGKKISGSAYKLTSDRAFHHGTLLISAALTKIADYLTPEKKKLLSKGISSVQSRVANLSEFVPDINHEVLCDAIIESFFEAKGTRCDIEILDHETLKRIPHLSSYFQQLSAWEWRFGKTPEFTYRLKERFEWGSIDLHIDTKGGIIREVSIFSDCLKPDMVEKLIDTLPGVRYDSVEIAESISSLMNELPSAHQELEDITRWLEQAIGDA